MRDFRKKDLLRILNVYQNHINDFVNVSEKDLNEMYFEIAKGEQEYQNELEYQRKKELYKGVTQYNYKSFPNEHKKQ
tara:strand:- start:2097 stop:2327 length:231 start_codon:yes stop_codon:yes gene_type:complete